MSQSSLTTSVQQTLEQEAKTLAISLANALSASSLPDKEKAALAALLPEMRLDQLAQFAEVLENSVEQAVKAEIADLVASMRSVLEKYAAIQAENDNDFMTGIAGIVEDLRKTDRSST